MFRSIVKGFRALDDFLTLCEEYTEERVWNGKFIYDLKFLSATTSEGIREAVNNAYTKIIASRAYNYTSDVLQRLVSLVMQLPVVSEIILLLVEGLRLCIKYFAHYLILIIIGLSSAYFLLMTFRHSPAFFVFSLLPVIFVNHLALSSFFNFVEKKAQGVHTSPAEALDLLRQTLPANTFIFLLQTAVIVIAGVFHLGFAFLLSALFATITIEWSSSFLYWLPIVMSGLLLAVLLYVLEILLAFSYTFVLQEKKSAFNALQRSSSVLQNHFRYSSLFYLILTAFAFLFIAFVTSNNFEGGFVVSLLIVSHAFLFLGFLLRRKYFEKESTNQTSILVTKIHRFAKLILILGLFSYLAIAALFIQIQPDILRYLEEQHPTVAEQYDYASYRNNEAGYEISYPQPWAIYRWNDASSTIYTNVTGTSIGGVKVTIDVKSVEESNYLMLYEANPGLIRYDTGTKNVTTKIANVVLQGKNAVKYAYTKTDTGQTEFQMHYLIRNEDRIYDIALTTSSKKIEAAYLEIFEFMVQSFKTLQR